MELLMVELMELVVVVLVLEMVVVVVVVELVVVELICLCLIPSHYDCTGLIPCKGR